MENKENKKPAEALADETLDDISGGANMGVLSTPGILSQEQMDELVQKVTDPDAPKPKLTSTLV